MSPRGGESARQNTGEFARYPHRETHARWAAFTSEHPDVFTQPETRIGSLMRPTWLTFWVSQSDAPSHRVGSSPPPPALVFALVARRVITSARMTPPHA